ncbi:hypothetical protein [Corynebacterium liangguodongii]|uniref:Uncharacterized protein n=1 Tax=Corynebacterium liangguodongii TaxID=2079535 RepID=A0A2S0WBL6_9CORY|nr:hypothetical protein [Corynebacterium liangguodongii]AWB83157.1 hypothetical protein C3E79_00535 [Corynebacterium liangguodongii]PWB98751.1 hypothetical protein DF219_09995 [Corynebacterium liangguodongii]
MSAPIDYNSLDDTSAGRIAQAGFIAAMFAVPDVVQGRGARAAAWTGLAAANLAAIAVMNAVDEDPRNDLTAAVERAPEKAGSPAQTWGVLGLGVAVLGALTYVNVAFYKAAAGWLRRRGVSRPYSALGFLAGAGYIAARRLAT